MTNPIKSTPRLRLRVSPAAESRLRGRHPWLFADSIREQNREGTSGELAVIYDRQDRFLAVGLYDPESPIRLRILHVGKPQTIDTQWWNTRLIQALEWRRGLFDANTTGYRLINGESDGWPGLVLDRYGSTLVLKLYTAIWLPRLDEVIELIKGALKPERIVLRWSRNIASQVISRVGSSHPGPHPWEEGECDPALEGVPNPSEVPQSEECIPSPRGEGRVRGTDAQSVPKCAREGSKTGKLHGDDSASIIHGAALEGSVVFMENGIRFEADVMCGQKTGFFLDQRENRRLVETFARGRDVLNAFSFSGGFSLCAARGGARSVTDLDISAHALESAKRNFALNNDEPNITRCRHESVQSDTFDWLKGNADRRFDLMILDPPSFAKREAERAGAILAYERLTRLGLDHLQPGGILVSCSCSGHVSAEEFFGAVRLAARKSGRRFQELQTTGHAPDHRATFKEAQYLKGIFLQF